MSLVDQSDLKFEVTVSKDNPLIRFYRKFWDPDGPITFCRIFWATVASPFVVFAIVILSPLWILIVGIAMLKERAQRKKAARPKTAEWPPKLPSPKKERRRIKFIDWIGRVVSSAILHIQSWCDNHKTGLAKTGKILSTGFIIAILGLGAFIIIMLFYIGVTALIAATAFFWHVMMIIGLSLAATVLMGLSVFIMGKFAHEHEYDYAVGYALSRPAVGAWGLFKMGYRAVKTNTCPRITITDK